MIILDITSWSELGIGHWLLAVVHELLLCQLEIHVILLGDQLILLDIVRQSLWRLLQLKRTCECRSSLALGANRPDVAEHLLPVDLLD